MPVRAGQGALKIPITRDEGQLSSGNGLRIPVVGTGAKAPTQPGLLVGRTTSMSAIVSLLGLFVSQYWQVEAMRFIAGRFNKPPLIIAADTTYLTGPKDSNGQIDYIAAMNQQGMDGVTLENNAALCIIDSIHPRYTLGRTEVEFYGMVGRSVPPMEGDYFHYSSGKFPRGPKEAAYFGDNETRANAAPWAEDDLASVAAWLSANQKFMDQIGPAIRRPRWFVPITSSKHPLGKPYIRTLEVILSIAGNSHSYSRAFKARAMLRLHQGNLSGAYHDLVTIHRLGRHIARGQFFIEFMIGTALDGRACEGYARCLESDKISVEFIQKMRQQLEALPPMPRAAQCLGTHQRLAILDSLSTMAFHGCHHSLPLFERGKLKHPLLFAIACGAGDLFINWNEALRYAILRVDSAVQNIEESDYNAQKTAYLALYTDIQMVPSLHTAPSILWREW